MTPSAIEIIHSQYICIQFSDIQIQQVSEYEKSNAKLAEENAYQDQYMSTNCHMSYEQYMGRVILSLIERQDRFPVDMSCKADCDELVTNNIQINPTNDTNTMTDEYQPIHHYFDSQIGTKLDKNVSDVNWKNKTRGSKHGVYQFRICGSRHGPHSILRQLAKIIQDTGLPNYSMARLSIKSRLNLPAWEHYLKDCPDKRLFQYLKFGFPLFLTDLDKVNNIDVSNHYSALQYPSAIQDYLHKEKSLRAILTPVTLNIQVSTVHHFSLDLKTLINID